MEKKFIKGKGKENVCEVNATKVVYIEQTSKKMNVTDKMMILHPECDRMDYGGAKTELKVDECLPPGNNRPNQMSIVIGE